MSFIKKRYRQMKDDAKKFASSKNVPEQAYSFWMVMQLVLIASSILSILTLVLISKLPENLLTGIIIDMVIPSWIIILFFGLGKYFFYAKILEVHYFSKLMSWSINKLDMYWWRKYRKQSPVTEMLHKAQEKSSKVKRKLTRPQKALIMAVMFGLLAYVYLYDNVLDVYNSIENMLIQQEIAENDLGKINDGLR